MHHQPRATTRKRSRLALAALLLLSTLPPALSLAAAPAVQAWVQRYPGASGNKIAVDAEGNVIVAAKFPGSLGSIIKYSGGGVPLWTNILGGIASFALDQSGNIYVTGYQPQAPMAPNDFVTRAYSKDGIPLWTNTFNGAANLNDQATAVAVSSNGIVYVTGYSTRSTFPSGKYRSIVTLAYTGAGTPLWTNVYDGGALSAITDCLAQALTVDDAGNVYVIGLDTEYTEAPASGYGVVGYSSAGAPLWTNSCNGCEIGQTLGIATGHNGTVYTIMQSYSGSYQTSAYSSGGALSWVNYGGSYWPAGASPVAVAPGTNGDVYVTGSSAGVGTGYDYLTFAYSSTGSPLWTNVYNGPASTDDYAQALAVGGSGNVYVTGSSPCTNGSYEYLTLAYSSNGVALWTHRFGESGGSQALALAVDRNDSVYVTGQSAGDCVTIKYTLAPTITLSATGLSPGPGCRLTIAAPTNITFRLEASTNLVNWLALTNFTNPPFTSMQYTDTAAASFPWRFYRTVWTP